MARCVGDHIGEFPTFCPMALATIGILPLPLMHRSIVLHMERAPRQLPRFDPRTIPSQREECRTVWRQMLGWAKQCSLNLDPTLPDQLSNRPADNWRVLVSVADACSEEWGRRAREAAIALSKYQDEDFGVLLLSDVRDVFTRRGADRLPSAVIVHELNELVDSLWSEWRGPRGDQQPRRLTQAQLSSMLRSFGIRPRSIWPLHRGVTTKSSKGYTRSQFTAAWAAYCDTGTPAQRGNVRPLWAAKDLKDGAA